MGSRWFAGDAPHRSVPEQLHDEISKQEQLHPDASSWTLTWLEGLPRCDLEGLVTVAMTHNGTVTVTVDGDAGDDDDWLK